jgi:hypothetical protein
LGDLFADEHSNFGSYAHDEECYAHDEDDEE